MIGQKIYDHVHVSGKSDSAYWRSTGDNIYLKNRVPPNRSYHDCRLLFVTALRDADRINLWKEWNLVCHEFARKLDRRLAKFAKIINTFLQRSRTVDPVYILRSSRWFVFSRRARILRDRILSVERLIDGLGFQFHQWEWTIVSDSVPRAEREWLGNESRALRASVWRLTMKRNGR